MLDLKKDEIQNSGVDIWITTGCKGTLQLSTGTGKTFCFFKALLKTSKVGDRILFLAETKQRELDLQVDLLKFEKIFNADLQKYNIQFNCYQSAYKWENSEWDLVCADEIHDSLSPSYSKFYINNKIHKLLGLSATIDKSTKYMNDNVEFTKGDLLNKICPIVFNYSLNDAVKEGTTKKLNIYVISHELNRVNLTIPAGTKDKPFLTDEKSAYDYWDNQFRKALFMPDGLSKTFKIRNTSAARAKILYQLHSKITAVKQLLLELNGKTLLFGNDIDSLLKITPNVICSKYTNAENETIRSNFDNNVINLIGSFKMLKQGANLSDLNNTIMVSYYSKELDIIQRLGRQRLTDETGSVFIFVTNNTQEEKWFNKAFENITKYNMIYCDNVQDTIKKYKENLKN
jgi:superfamily II DNA or RNA helicase